MYNPQELYDSPGGLFDEDSLRTIDLEFYMHKITMSCLVNAWFYNPSERIPARLTLNGVLYDSVGAMNTKEIPRFVYQMMFLVQRFPIILLT